MNIEPAKTKPRRWLFIVRSGLSALLLLISATLFVSAFGTPRLHSQDSSDIASAQPEIVSEPAVRIEAANSESFSKGARLMASFTVFLLAIFVGVEVINKVPPTLHTPLMSGSNAISGITVIGALLAAGHNHGGLGGFLGLLAVALATINIAGGFLVTNRMLMMFKKR